jgi:acetyl-CoA C-acetyltransferase
MKDEIVITGLARTPIGSFMGSLSSLSSHELGSSAIQGALQSSGISSDEVSEVYMGNVLTAGCGQAPARQAAKGAGLGDQVSCVTLNKVCGSGMYSVIASCRSLLVGDSKVCIAGGMESMSQVPFLAKGVRAGLNLGHGEMVDSLIQDGLWDPYHNQHMGNCAELCARELNISREEQDNYTIMSYERSLKAIQDGLFQNEIVPCEVLKKKKMELIEEDEEPFKVKFDKISSLRPVFDKKGSVTAANASTINDGAAALVMMTGSQALKLGMKPLVKVVSYAGAAQEPQWFTTAPIPAINKALDKAGWSCDDVDLFEINEAFSVVSIAAQRELKIPKDKLNVWGGAISLGHPIGASGARILVTLISALLSQGKKKGCAAICIGGGEALAICLEVI